MPPPLSPPRAVLKGKRLAVGIWGLVGAGGGRLVAVGGWWRLAVGDGWRFVVGCPWGLSFQAVLSKNKICLLKDSPAPPTPPSPFNRCPDPGRSGSCAGPPSSARPPCRPARRGSGGGCAGRWWASAESPGAPRRPGRGPRSCSGGARRCPTTRPRRGPRRARAGGTIHPVKPVGTRGGGGGGACARDGAQQTVGACARGTGPGARAQSGGGVHVPRAHRFLAVVIPRQRADGRVIRAFLKGGGGGKRVSAANRNERSWKRSLLRGQDMGKRQDHRNSIDQRLAVGG